MTKQPALDVAKLDKYHLLVGRIASGHAAFEFHIDSMIWFLSGIDKLPGAAITSQLSHFAKFRAAAALLFLFEGSDDYIVILNKLANDARPITEARNRAIHDAWVHNSRRKGSSINCRYSGKNRKTGSNP